MFSNRLVFMVADITFVSLYSLSDTISHFQIQLHSKGTKQGLWLSITSRENTLIGFLLVFPYIVISLFISSSILFTFSNLSFISSASF